MKSNLLEFLFGVSQQEEAVDDVLTDDFARMLEEADASEAELMAADKSPLVAALKAIGINSSGLREDPEGFLLVTDDREQYIAALEKISDPEAMHELAKKGWVAFKGGDVAMSNEAPEYHLRFLEIATAGGSDAEKSDETDTEIMKQAREFATEEPEHEETDGVEHDAPEGNKLKKVKVGEPTDGKKPEGKIKDSLTAQEVANRLIEGGDDDLDDEDYYENNAGDETNQEDYANYKRDLKDTGEKPKSYRQWIASRRHVEEHCGQPGSRLKTPAQGGKVQHAFKAKKKK